LSTIYVNLINYIMSKSNEIQITINRLIEIIYEMYLKDLNCGKINCLKKVIKNKESLKNYEKPKLFNYEK